MALTCQQIVTLATQTAKCLGWTSQAGQLLNVILSELCQGYDLDVARAVTYFNFGGANGGGAGGGGFSSGFSSGFSGGGGTAGVGTGSGPYTLPTDWLRANREDVFYTILGVKYVMIPVAVAEFDALVQQAGLSAYPENYAVDNGPIATGGAPLMYVWPPPAGAYAVTARYYRQMADIATPETDATSPWFPNTQYLLRRLAGELMLLTNDDRAAQFLGGLQDGSGFEGAAAILDRYLKMKDDAQVTKRVKLDRRFFGTDYNRLSNTKLIGW